jgi:prevent-host-death family protein
MKKIALSVLKDDLSKYLRMAEGDGIIITRHGRPAGLLIGFETEDDWFDYQLENDPRFVRRIAKARADIRAGRGIAFEDLVAEFADQVSEPAPAPVIRGKKRAPPR